MLTLESHQRKYREYESTCIIFNTKVCEESQSMMDQLSFTYSHSSAYMVHI